MENGLYNDNEIKEKAVEARKEKPTDFYAVIVIMQSTILALTIFILIALKYIAPKQFTQISQWYKENITVDTTPELVLSVEEQK
jgi:hypothetical protein